jgi:DNA-binding NtrC family response regulator
MNIEVVECALPSSGEEKKRSGDLVKTRVFSDTISALLAGIQARVSQGRVRVALLTPEQQKAFGEDPWVFDVGGKESSKALSELFLRRQYARKNSELGKVLLQDATDIKERDGLTKAIKAFLNSAREENVSYLYLVVVEEKLLNSFVGESVEREEIDSRLPQLESEIIGRSPAMQKVRKQIILAARHEKVPVYVLGETGSGKTAIAWQIHRYSSRVKCENAKCACAKDSKAHFKDVNCGQIPLELFESEMFGTRRGNQLIDKFGQFELAHLGTLFLDEMHHMRPTHQPKLLTFLGDKHIRPVNDSTSGKTIDVRVMFAAARDLEEMANAGEFLSELLYRIKVGLVIEMPPLRERGEDMVLIAGECWPKVWENLAASSKTGPHGVKGNDAPGLPELPKDLLETMASYSWPGNVRQLLGVLNRIALRALDGNSPNSADFREEVGWTKVEAVTIPRHGSEREKAMDEALRMLGDLYEQLLRVQQQVDGVDRSILATPIREALMQIGNMKADEALRKRLPLFRSLHALEGELNEIEFMVGDLVSAEEDHDWGAKVIACVQEAMAALKSALSKRQAEMLTVSYTRNLSLHPSLLEIREKLARHAHEIWMEKRAQEGWRYGKERSDRAKTNPDMVSYDALSETEKSYDREMALGTVQALQALGFEVVRVGEKRGQP